MKILILLLASIACAVAAPPQYLLPDIAKSRWTNNVMVDETWLLGALTIKPATIVCVRKAVPRQVTFIANEGFRIVANGQNYYPSYAVTVPAQGGRTITVTRKANDFHIRIE